VVLLVGDNRIWRGLDEIVRLNHHDVLEKGKILNEQINGVISVLDTRNGNVADL
jgi:hypothetical protein